MRLTKKAKGNSFLRAKQYEKALQGDNVMLVWLGKNRLKQTDREQEQKVESTNVILERDKDKAQSEAV